MLLFVHLSFCLFVYFVYLLFDNTFYPHAHTLLLQCHLQHKTTHATIKAPPTIVKTTPLTKKTTPLTKKTSFINPLMLSFKVKTLEELKAERGSNTASSCLPCDSCVGVVNSDGDEKEDGRNQECVIESKVAEPGSPNKVKKLCLVRKVRSMQGNGDTNNKSICGDISGGYGVSKVEHTSDSDKRSDVVGMDMGEELNSIPKSTRDLCSDLVSNISINSSKSTTGREITAEWLRTSPKLVLNIVPAVKSMSRKRSHHVMEGSKVDGDEGLVRKRRKAVILNRRKKEITCDEVNDTRAGVATERSTGVAMETKAGVATEVSADESMRLHAQQPKSTDCSSAL